MRTITDFLSLTSAGLYCEPGGFYIDPRRPVERAVITHAHHDHARRGSARYLSSQEGERLLRTRIGSSSQIATLAYGETIRLGTVQLSLHPAGHVLGSSQVRLEHEGQVCVVSGDYKRQPDATCSPFELLKCHTFVSECTFGLPIYRWPEFTCVIDEIHRWWKQNQQTGMASVLFAYALGKSQRILAAIDPSIGKVVAHGAIWQLNRVYAQSDVTLPRVHRVDELDRKFDWSQALIVAPPSAIGSAWLKRFGSISQGMASGWMTIRGLRRWRSVDRGFVISDHVDWNGLLQTIQETGCETVWLTHGDGSAVARFLTEQGQDAQILEMPELSSRVEE